MCEGFADGCSTAVSFQVNFPIIGSFTESLIIFLAMKSMEAFAAVAASVWVIKDVSRWVIFWFWPYPGADLV